MAYGFGNYNMGLGMGYPQTYGIGFNTNPIQQPTGTQAEVNPTAYTSTVKSDDSGAKVGALIVASAALAGLMIHGANVEKSAKAIAKAIEKNAPKTEKVEQKVEKAVEETVTKAEKEAKKVTTEEAKTETVVEDTAEKTKQAAQTPEKKAKEDAKNIKLKSDDIKKALENDANSKHITIPQTEVKQQKLLGIGEKQLPVHVPRQTINKTFTEVLNDEYPKPFTLPTKKEPLRLEYIPSAVDVKTNPYERTQLRHGVLPNGKEYLLDIKDGKVVKLINGEGNYTENEVKIAKFLNKWNIE